MEYGQAERRDYLADITAAHEAQQMKWMQARENKLVKEQEEKDARDNRIVDITVHPYYLSLNPEKQKEALKYFSDSRYTDPSGKGRAVDVRAGVSEVENTSKLFEKFAGSIVEAKKQAVVDAWGAVEAAKATGDKNKIEKAMGIYNNANTAYEISHPEYGKHLFKLKEEEAKQKGKVNEPNNDFEVFMAGEREKNPGITNAEISKNWHKMKTAEAEAAAKARGEGFAGSRAVQVIDRNTGRGKIMSLEQVKTANEIEPGRYEPIAGSPDYKADAASLANQVKVRDMMAGFIGNMNKQIDRMGEITKDVERFDARILNVPLVKARTMIKGSPQESKISMYLTEISSEMGKIASGSSASISELSVETRKRWENIHDKNLSIKDMMELLRETKHAGTLRLKSSEDIISETKKRFGGGSGSGGGNVSDPYGIR
jgi:hypothetical protein